MAASLVTGGAGFFGSHLVDALVARGDKVRVLDNFSSGTQANLSQSRQAVELIEADLNAPGVLGKAVQGVQYVYHFMEATRASAEGSETPGKWAVAADTLNVLNAALAAGVKRVVYPSSGSVYGPSTSGKLKECDPTFPTSAVGFAKQAAEHQCAGFTILHGLETVRLRFFNVFGPRQSGLSMYAAAIPTILRAMLAGTNPIIPDSPFELQDFMYIADAVHATLLAAQAPRVAGKVYNIARGRNHSLVQVVTTANQILCANLQPLFSEFRAPAGLTRAVDISHAEAELGFCPSTDLKQGLSKFVDYLRLQRDCPPAANLDLKQTGLKEPYFLRRDRPPAVTRTSQGSVFGATDNS